MEVALPDVPGPPICLLVVVVVVKKDLEVAAGMATGRGEFVVEAGFKFVLALEVRLGMVLFECRDGYCEEGNTGTQLGP